MNMMLRALLISCLVVSFVNDLKAQDENYGNRRKYNVKRDGEWLTTLSYQFTDRNFARYEMQYGRFVTEHIAMGLTFGWNWRDRYNSYLNVGYFAKYYFLQSKLTPLVGARVDLITPLEGQVVPDIGLQTQLSVGAHYRFKDWFSMELVAAEYLEFDLENEQKNDNQIGFLVGPRCLFSF